MGKKNSIIHLQYNQDYDEGVAHVQLLPHLFTYLDEYNPELAQFCAGVMAAASDRRGGLGRAEYLAPALVEQLELQDVTLYNYTKCTHPHVHVHATSQGYTMNDFAFSIAHKTLHGPEPFELILVTMRGTESWSEGLFADFLGTLWDWQLVRWDGFCAYRSFALFAQKVLDGLQQYELEHESVLAGKQKIYLLTGHSLGGAAAQLVGSRLTSQNKRVAVYTFGALNALTNDGTCIYPNIWNIINYYDTYGPQGWGALGFRPANGRKTVTHKLGQVRVFQRDFRREFDTLLWSKNHVMASYYQAMRDRTKFNEHPVVEEWSFF